MNISLVFLGIVVTAYLVFAAYCLVGRTSVKKKRQA